MATIDTRVPSFPRWVLCVLGPVYIVYACALALINVNPFSWILVELYISLSYGPAFVFWLAKVKNKSISDSLLLGFFALCIELIIVIFLYSFETFYATYLGTFFMVGWITDELSDPFPLMSWIAMTAVVGAVYGLAQATLQWVLLAFPVGTALRWLNAHVLGAGVGAIAAALAFYWMIGADPPLFISQRMWLWSLLSPFAALPHLYLTWRVLALAPSVAKKSEPVIAIRSAIGRTACCMFAGYALVTFGRLMVGDTAWDALIWPYHDVRHVVFGVKPDPPNEGTPVRIANQEYLIPAEFAGYWEPERRRNSYRYLSLRIPAGLVIVGESGPADIDNIVLENEYIMVDMKNSKTHLFWFADDGIDKHHLCKRKHRRHLTVCWHEDGKFELFKVPHTYDYKTSITYGRNDGVVLYRADSPDAHVLASCTEVDRQCSIRFDDGEVGVTVRFAWSLQSYARTIVGGIEGQLRRYRSRAEAFRQAAD